MYIIFLDEITLGLYLTFVAKKIANFLSNNVECMVSGSTNPLRKVVAIRCNGCYMDF